MELDPTVEVVLGVVRGVELAVCLAVAVLLVRRHRRAAAPATGAALALFVVLCVVLAGGWWEPADPDTAVALVVSDVALCALLSVPYLMVRLAHALGGLGAGLHRACAGATVALLAVTVAVPRLPDDGEPVAGWVVPYVACALVVWTVECAVAAAGLWRAGRGQASVVQRRMRALSSAAVLVALTIIIAGVTIGSSPGWMRVVTSVLGLVAVVQFAVAFLPPTVLRVLWRQQDVATLARAERGLMVALSRDDVAATIVPALGAVFGGSAAMLDADGAVVRSTGLVDEEAAALAAAVQDAPGRAPLADLGDGALAARLGTGWLAVRAGRVAPVFGDDEAVLLGRVAAVVDLALQRVHLHERERASRLAAEAANQELETLLYSVSHDLRSPLISVLGYLDVLRSEEGAALSASGTHYVERISVNAVYMQSLITDLLELSRIGRVDPPAERLDLHTTAEQVLDAARLRAPGARLEVASALPPVLLTDVRARQLLTNLVDNALKHGGRDDLRVTVAAARDDAGRLVLEVRDDGRGVPAEYRERVVRVFERLDAPKSSPGTGMGLAICRRIAESAGGSLVVDGPPPGASSGTTVRVVLPADVLLPDLPAPRTADVPVEETA